VELPFRPFQPDIENLYKTLRREKTARPVLFEFIVNLEICHQMAPRYKNSPPGTLDYFKMIIEAFKRLGYDYAPVYTAETDILSFEKGAYDSLSSRSQNQGALITDRDSFDRYPWPDPQRGNYDLYHQLSEHLPDGMKLLGFSNGGILENTTDIVGFENLCAMSLMDPELTGEIFKNVGKRLLEFYSILSTIDSVGACVVTDDWGFKTQPMLPPEMMEAYVFPYTKRIVEVIHENRKPVIRAANTGISGFIDSNGNILSRTELYQRGFLTEKFRTDTTTSFYSKYGDLFSYIWIIASIILIANHFGKARRF